MDEQFEKTVVEFERVWQTGKPPDLATYAMSRNQRELLVELVLIDIEQRWRSCADGNIPADALGGQPRLEDYSRHLPGLGSTSSLPAFAAAEEYRVRRLWGDRPNHDHVLSRFPHHGLALLSLLRAVDRELRADDPDVPLPATPKPRQHFEVDPRAPLPWSDYVLREHLGTGGMGKVYRARQISLDRSVAVKALLKKRQHDPTAVERFLQEARILARLRHPHVIGVHGIGRFPAGGLFLVMDLVDGDNLEQRLTQASLAPAEAVRIALELADAVAHAHSHSVIHCDLKPGNLLLDRDGTVYVADFGFAQLLHTDAEYTMSLAAGGTAGYMAPEQRGGTTTAIGSATDIFGIGAVLYRLLTGQKPEATSNDPELVPAQFRAVCTQCLEDDPARRFSDANAFADALRRCVMS